MLKKYITRMIFLCFNKYFCISKILSAIYSTKTEFYLQIFCCVDYVVWTVFALHINFVNICVGDAF